MRRLQKPVKIIYIRNSRAGSAREGRKLVPLWPQRTVVWLGVTLQGGRAVPERDRVARNARRLQGSAAVRALKLH